MQTDQRAQGVIGGGWGAGSWGYGTGRLTPTAGRMRAKLRTSRSRVDPDTLHLRWGGREGGVYNGLGQPTKKHYWFLIGVIHGTR